eukprot:gene27907-66793_t
MAPTRGPDAEQLRWCSSPGDVSPAYKKVMVEVAAGTDP